MWRKLLILSLLAPAIYNSPVPGEPDHGHSGDALRVQMPGAVPKGNDNYLCSQHKLSKIVPEGLKGKSVYVTQMEAVEATALKAHHILLYTCDREHKVDGNGIWDCGHHGVCPGGKQGIIFAWAKNAPKTTLPDKVSFELNDETTTYLVLQVHYAHELDEADHTGLSLTYQAEETPYAAAIYLLGRPFLSIPPQTPVVHGDMNCLITQEMNLFAFRTHAHDLGVVISGYKYEMDNDKYTEVAKGNPQWPQAFYPMKKVFKVKPGDFLAARCTYNSTGRDRYTGIGSTGADEMCNLYIMYYVEAGKAQSGGCWQIQSPKITKNLPEDSDKALPRNATLEEHAKHRMKGDLDMDNMNDHKNDEDKRTRKKGDLDAPVENKDGEFMEIQMPGAEPKRDDDYFCTAFNVSKLTGGKRVYVTEFVAEATAAKAHHLIVQKCAEPIKAEGEIWSCLHHATCKTMTKIMFAWAKDAPPTKLPPDVGFKLDDDDGFLVLQVHYKHPLKEKDYTGLKMRITEEKPKNFAGILLLFRSNLEIPPHRNAVHGDVNCEMRAPLTLFAFRTHAHWLGAVITGYKVESNGKRFTEVARGDPQRPQTFYPMHSFTKVKAGDFVAARCTYNSTMETETVRIGATAGDEMCNLYLMYYTSDEHDDIRYCGDEERPMGGLYPGDSDVPIDQLSKERISPLITNEVSDIRVEKKQGRQIPPQMPIPQYNYPLPVPVAPPIVHHHHHPPPQVPPQYTYGQPHYYPGPLQPQQPLQPYNTNSNGEGMNANNEVEDTNNEDEDEIEEALEALEEYEDEGGDQNNFRWKDFFAAAEEERRTGKQMKNKKDKNAYFSSLDFPAASTSALLGQVCGVAIDIYGNPVLFHRGERVWNGNTFGSDNVYNGDKMAPITANTILTLNSTGHVVNAWGKNMFFMPHMITIDNQNNVWVTDVALHQIFKFPPYGGKTYKPLIVLGSPFVPGNNDRQYCKPTSVAVSADGKSFFVADGYCNSRIIKYNVDPTSHEVTKVWQLGTATGTGLTLSPGNMAFNIPHSLALAEDRRTLCVADRENKRIQCFDSDAGTFKKTLSPKGLSRVYAVAYSPANGGNIYAVNGPDPFSAFTGNTVEGLIIGIDDGLKKGTFAPTGKDFQNPHDVAVSNDANFIYVGELNPFLMWKLTSAEWKGNSSTTIVSYPAVPSGDNPADPKSASSSSGPSNIEKLGELVPKSTWGVSLAVASVLFTLCMSVCVACRRCRKRGKGTMMQQSNAKKKSKSKGLGDILGRSKEGFQRLKTEEDDLGDDDAEDAESDSEDDLEQFSVPALRA